MYPLRGKECSTQQVPGLKNKFKNYNAFGLATLEDVYDTKSLENAMHLKAHTFSNSVLINTKAGFNLVELPKEAQVSSVFGMLYDDFDNDGLKDIVLAGNLFNSETETPRNDASQGLFLKGNGTENFTPVSNYTSGLNISGDVKKVKPIRLGKPTDEKKSFIVAINNDFLKLITIN